MTLHAFLQYLKYKSRAKGRHGVHSPFVYQFIEDGLQKTKAPSLKELLIAYFNNRNIIFFETDFTDWLKRYGAIKRGLKGEFMIAVKDIHATANTTNQWNRLRNDWTVTLSIDLFEYGLLFFDEEFKEKQHFTLKWA